MKTPDGKAELAVGVGATLCVGSDRYPYTVIDFTSSGKTITVVGDNYTADKAGGHDYFGTQKWIITPAVPGTSLVVKARWSRRMGCYQIKGTRLHVGKRDAYQNPSF